MSVERERAPMTEAWRTIFAELRTARVAAGLCDRCGKPSRPGRTQCAPCAAKHSAKALARYRSRPTKPEVRSW